MTSFSLSKEIPKFSDVLSIPSNPEDLFTLIYPIGIGAYGKVYKAIHNSTLKIFAIKIIDYTKDGLNNKSNISFNYNSVQEETALMRLIQNSDFFVKYYGSYYSRKSNTIWLILEYCSCGSLIDLMFSINRSFSEIEIATFIEMVLQGLICLHDLNIIHRDIKAQNILLTEEGLCKLGDFGVGIKLTDKEYRHSKKGSPYWMSPQVILQKDYDIKTDIWSLGITCVELAESQPPFADLKPMAVMNKIGKHPPNVEDIINVEEYSESFVDFVRKCITVDPEKRPSAKELIEHEFIRKNSKGKEYVKDLINKFKEDIKDYMDNKSKELKSIKKDNNNNNDNHNNNDNNLINNIDDKNSGEENNNNNNSNEELYSIINENSENNVNNIENNENINENIDNNYQENNSMIIIDDGQNEEIPKIMEDTKKFLENIDIDGEVNDDEENYEQKKLEEMKNDIMNKIKEKKQKEKNNENEDIKSKESDNNIILKTPTKKNNKKENNENYSMNINENIKSDIQQLLLKEEPNKKINKKMKEKRSEATTGFTWSKNDSNDEKKYVSNKIMKIENNILNKEKENNNNYINNIYTKKKINFIENDLSNIDDDSDEEKIESIKHIMNINLEDNRLEKCYTERKYLKTDLKQNKINILDKKKIEKYMDGFDISTRDDNVVKNIHFSAYKEHKKYFN